VICFDRETNGISDWSCLSDLENVWCLCAFDTETSAMHRAVGDEQIKELLKLFSTHDYIVGHNSIGFDYPVLQKMYGFKHRKVLDTVVMSRCIHPDIRDEDFKRHNFPKDLIGRHSLASWGYRIGILKGEYGSTSDWSAYSDEMGEYCEQDVIVTRELYRHLMQKKPSVQMLALEHDFARAMRKQEYNGFPFDIEKAEKLCMELTARRAELKEELQEQFPPQLIQMKAHYWQTPDGKEWNTKKAAVEAGHKAKDITKGRNKTKTIPFNPNSRDQIAEHLIANGWKPEAYEGKRPAINETVLNQIGTPQALKLCEYLLITKRLGQISEGNQAWLKLVKDNRIHGSVNTNGAVSGRCTHNNPNVAQVPASRAPYGEQCRELFHPPKGKVLVGADASGLELRCLAHYLWPKDNGAYANEILVGDIHTANQQAAGLETRDQAKTFIYAFLYGAGDAKIGSIVNGSSVDGRRLKQSFMQKIPAISYLVSAVKRRVEMNNTLNGLDGRILPCRSAHSALNLLLQSAGAVIMKQALVDFVSAARHPYELHGNIHDEVQFSCDKDHADDLGKTFCRSLQTAGKKLAFRCPLDGEYSIGENWSQTH
jgi:DNA polymerase I-like protein with 3'-5' exonuclease and polymerase domains